MRKRNYGLLGAAIAMAGLAGVGQVSEANSNLTAKTEATAPIKAPAEKSQTKKVTVEDIIGGIPLTSYFPNYGMSPKEYGVRYGNGGSKRSNRLRYSHNAKLKRRMAYHHPPCLTRGVWW